MKTRKIKVERIYKLLDKHFGSLGWWPARTDFEVIVGAILTQNTAWSNVEKAIEKLRKKKLLNPKKILASRFSELEKCIRSSGYYRQKAVRLKDISRFIMDECGGSLKKFKSIDTESLRKKLLEVKGVGPETADSMLLYAFKRPVFVVDAYTKRIFARHMIIEETSSYNEVQSLVHDCFGRRTSVYNAFHASIVEAGKRFCRKKKPLCSVCPLNCMPRKP